MQGTSDIRRRRVRRTLSEVKQKLEEALRLSRLRERFSIVPLHAAKRPH